MAARIKIMCLNMWLGGELFEVAKEFIRKEAPDVLLLQEVYDGHQPNLAEQYRTMDVLRSDMHMQFAADDFAATFREADNKVPEYAVECGNAIFSKYPIVKRFAPVFFNEKYSVTYSNHDAAQYPYEPRNLQHVCIDVEGALLDVFNFQGVWDLDGENDSPKRLQMSRKIVDAIKGKPNVILGGDTNVRPNTKTIANIEEYLTNIFKDELTTTFNMRRKTNPGYADSVVDMLFVSPNITVVDHHCPDIDISDHLPLVVTVELALLSGIRPLS